MAAKNKQQKVELLSYLSALTLPGNGCVPTVRLWREGLIQLLPIRPSPHVELELQ